VSAESVTFSVTVALVGDPTGHANGYHDNLYIPWAQRTQAQISVPWSATVSDAAHLAAGAFGVSSAADFVPYGVGGEDDLSWYDGIPPGGYTSPPVVDDLGLASWEADPPYRHLLNAHAVGISRYAGDPGRAYLVIADPDDDTVIEDPPFDLVDWLDFRRGYDRLRRFAEPIASRTPQTWQSAAAVNVVRLVRVLDAHADRWSAHGLDPYGLSDVLDDVSDSNVLRRLLDLDRTEAEDLLRGFGRSLHRDGRWYGPANTTAWMTSSLNTAALGVELSMGTDAELRAQWAASQTAAVGPHD
jgi:hypothetical protein